ncbi:MAG: NAD(+) diphosphatase [Spirochaetaceae bacterium]|jgi:NAD+ diphosphatase|nr:NAD(+) diphosphatase [Spirochaetaceae bacterium]
MAGTKVYLFQGDDLVIPESMGDDEVLGGVDRYAADSAFGKPEYYAVPPAGVSERFAEGPLTACLLGGGAPLPPLWRRLPVRRILSFLAADGELPGSGSVNSRGSGQLLRAYHILQWRNDSAYCGSCGEKNGDSPDELARLCPRCGRIEYPRIAPAVIILVTDDVGRALLAHNRKFKDDLYSLIAGFAEAGESLEAAVRRELKEEAAIEVTDIRYVTSQSWPFPNSLMAGFTARYAGGELKPDGVEILDARWFTRESALPELPAPGSVSRYIIDRWLGASRILTAD